MYKLKYKMQGEDPVKKEFLTLQGVADFISLICGADRLADMLEVAKEYNIRFYLSYKK